MKPYSPNGSPARLREGKEGPGQRQEPLGSGSQGLWELRVGTEGQLWRLGVCPQREPLPPTGAQTVEEQFLDGGEEIPDRTD